MYLKKMKPKKNGIEIKKNGLGVPLDVIEDKDAPGQYLLKRGQTRLAASIKIVKTRK